MLGTGQEYLGDYIASFALRAGRFGDGVSGGGRTPCVGEQWVGSCFMWRELPSQQSPVSQALCSLLPEWLLLVLP